MKISDLKNYKVVVSGAPAPASSPAPAPLDPSTHADTATFPSTGHESVIGGAAQTLGNIPSSAINLGKSAVSFLDPRNLVTAGQKLGTSIGDALNEGDNPAQLAKNTATGLPKAAYEAVTPAFLQHLFSGDIEKARATIENDPVGQIAPLILLGRQAATKAGKGAEFDAGISKVASPVTKPVAATADFAKGAAGGAAKFAGSQLTGLSPNTLQQIVANPQEFSKTAQSTITRPALAADVGKALTERQSALADTGAGYSGVRTGTSPVPVEPTYLDNLIQETTGLAVKDGKLQTSGSASIRNPSDVSALQNKIYNVWKPEFEKGYLTPEQYLNFRDDLSKMAYNDSGIGKSGALSHLAEVMRGKANTTIRPNIPGLESVDQQYAPQITELKALSQGLVDKEGNLTDAAINRIANATGKGKDPQLARLEELSPGITDKIKILKAVEDIANSRENKPGTYTRAAVGVSGIVTANPYLIASAVLSLPEFAVPLLRGLGMSQELASKTIKTLGIKDAAKAVNNLQLPASVKDKKMGDVPLGLSTKDVTRFLHQDDKAVMTKFIDNARLGKPLSDAQFAMAEKLAQRFGISMDKGLSGVASQFEKILQGKREFKGTVLPGMSNKGK